ncbi:Bcr/CflA family drug resistance efflux transporter [Komagataeibacter rhaeticus]|uniref:Bcr/CflA family efflux transporter n=3 Tax=Komagataeibacter rhaeticus TaxID=215221 RepID=A0A181CE93_9PROT|nr:multidrug effflux MFS transporter [Komagataeibacter rhaeticus]MBL7240881.1 multidrug effflux MFS transporter [Komagataeibacter rhaeticus]PYD54878.1 Bcr/CflA family drug resistance efflux transporter [Komagataeibacter rhaeticus]QIP36511.1 multidrug effflux MFS transporter [Komagataeibacter rhaeticus]SAY49880.1 Bicyclomycin resistance protein [Komagataeibacter rhaeticus]GBQ12552.1 multidrug ABC transporter [Komagataeibacter rhaeticus DSM 16663]
MPARTTPATAMPYWMIALLGLLTAIGPLSTDMYLPAFPFMDSDLAGGYAGASQVTLAAWFAGLAVGQFSLGPISDRLGRRIPLVGGLVLFIAGSMGCALADGFDLFCVCRFVSALGGAASAVVPRAIVRDVATGAPGARIMSQLMLVFGVMPILAPSLGSLVLSVGHWRWIFWIAVGYGMVGLVTVLATLRDTMPMDRRIPFSLAGMIGRYGGLVREPVFMSSALLNSFSSFVMFAYITSAPMVFEHLLGFTPGQFGAFFGMNAAMFIVSAQINARLVHRIDLSRLVDGGIGCVTVAAVACLVLSLAGVAGVGHPLLVCVLVMCITGCLGFIGPNATVMALTHHGHQAGSASALMGTIQFSLAAASGFIMGHVAFHSPAPLAMVIMAGVVCMMACNMWRQACERRAAGQGAS